MDWQNTFGHAAGYGFFLLVGLLVKAFREWRKPKPCPHGLVGPCQACTTAAEGRKAAAMGAARRSQIEVEWEQLRRSEIKRLSQERRTKAESYFQMGSREFEDSIVEVFRKLGYRVTQTSYSRDGGKDAIAWKDNRKYVIECKRYNAGSSTGRRDLQILLAAKGDEGADEAIFVSTGRFTSTAIDYAKLNGIQIYDRTRLPDLINSAYEKASNTAKARTMCAECGAVVWVSIPEHGEQLGTCPYATTAALKQIHTVRSTIKQSNLIYPELNLDIPWCPGDDIPMRRTSGQRGQFWGCPKFPECRYTRNYVPPPPEVVAAEREGLLSLYQAIDEITKQRIQNEIEQECAKHGISPKLLGEMPILVAGKYKRETR
jgi:hypothetical protein